MPQSQELQRTDSPELTLPPDGEQVPARECPECQTENAKSRKFCSQCGGILQEPCLKCGDLTGVEDRFCGGCGINVADHGEERLREIQDALANADRLQSQGCFQDAIDIATRLGEENHPRLRSVAREARRRLEAWT